MARLVLHIGTEKTGTTALQIFLRANRKKLAHHCVFVPSYLNWPRSHGLLPVLFADPFYPNKLSLSVGISSLEKKLDARQSILARLHSDVLANPEGLFIISSEYLQSRLIDKESVKALSARLMEIFESISILLYIRRPHDCAYSLMSTSIKSGSCDLLKLACNDPYVQIVCSHRDTIDRWSEAFGERSIDLRIYNKRLLKEGGIETNFSSSYLKNIHGLKLSGTGINQALSHHQMLLLNILNKYTSGNTSLQKLRSLVVLFIEKIQIGREGKDRQYQQSYINEFESFYRASDEYVRAKFFPEKDTLWE